MRGAAGADDGGSPRRLRRVANAAVALLSLDLVGVGEAALQRTVDYTMMRHQFGRPIASFQAAQHLVANMHIALSAARLAAQSAVFWIGQGHTATRETAIARMHAATAAKSDHARRAPIARRHGLCRGDRSAPVVGTGAGAVDARRRRRRRGDGWLEADDDRVTRRDSLIDAESASRVGTVAATATGEVNRREWQRWAASVGDHNPLWFDADYARANGYAT